tara:strand:+ start:1274 stop:1840 length:567 start_codon:yes stop_codon:yes gene_type:complete
MKDILIVCALKQETDNQLNDFNVLYTGVGKVNATYELTRYLLKNETKLVINYGTAGSRNLPIGELIECDGFVQRDMDASKLGFPKGKTPFDETPTIIGEGNVTVGTGDSFVEDVSNELPIIDVFDMESYPLAKICNEFNIPFKCWKYITDNANDKSPKQWEENISDGILKFKNILIGSLHYWIKSDVK